MELRHLRSCFFYCPWRLVLLQFHIFSLNVCIGYFVVLTAEWIVNRWSRQPLLTTAKMAQVTGIGALGGGTSGWKLPLGISSLAYDFSVLLNSGCRPS